MCSVLLYIYYIYKLYSYRDPQRKYVHVNTLYQILVNTFTVYALMEIDNKIKYY